MASNILGKYPFHVLYKAWCSAVCFKTSFKQPPTRVVSKNNFYNIIVRLLYYISQLAHALSFGHIIKACALRKIEENTVLLTCAIQGAQHINSMRNLRFSSCLGAKFRHQGPLGTCQSTALPILLYDTYNPLYVKVSVMTSNFVRKRNANRASI